ncbi:MAG TPA: outer membrane lipoprotein-sorting protein [Terriglobia bacterium]|nr:outer membrane lipoprotein-sorting protein [Terriglobia bacterium]
MFRTVLTTLAAFTLLAPAARAQTVDEVIAKNVEALGGMDKLKAVQTRRMTATLKVQSFQAGVLQENKRPDKVRQEFILQGLAQVSAYDGKAGWQVNPFQGRKDPELLSADDTKGLQVQADIDGPMVDYKEKGSTAELVGHDSVEGTDCYKIKVTLKNGDVRYYYLDSDSYMVIKLETQTMIRGSLEEGETYYGDYEKVNGVYYPFAFETGQKDQPGRVQFTLDKIEVNVPLDDSLFTMPAGKAKTAGSSG